MLYLWSPCITAGIEPALVVFLSVAIETEIAFNLPHDEYDLRGPRSVLFEVQRKAWSGRVLASHFLHGADTLASTGGGVMNA